MPEPTLGVGIVGVNPIRGWAATAHPGTARAAELPDPGTQRPQSGIRGRSRRSVRGGCGVLRPRAAGDPTRHRRGRYYRQGVAPSRARLRRTRRGQGGRIVAGARGPNEPAELAAPAALTQKWPALASLEGTPAYNVGRAYAAFAADIDNRTHGRHRQPHSHRARLRRRRRTPRGHHRHRKVRCHRRTREGAAHSAQPNVIELRLLDGRINRRWSIDRHGA
jgi:hypothetical protein